MIDERRIDPPDIEVHLIDRVLHPLGFETVQIGSLLVLPNHAVREQLFRAMNLALGVNNFKDQRCFFILR